MTIEYALRTMNLLDTVEADRTTGKPKYIHFHATTEDRDVPGRDGTIVLLIEGNSLNVASSRALPVYGWKAHADAAKRATEFLLLSGMTDQNEGNSK